MYKKLLLLFLVLSLTACSATAKTPVVAPVLPATPKPVVPLKPASTPAPQPLIYDKETFIQHAAKTEGLSAQKITAILNQAQFQPSVINLMNKPYEGLPWYRYQVLYVRPSLVTGGYTFWQQYSKILAAASTQFGVPSEIIVAILGVETGYGQNEGKFRALDALYTLAFYYPRRAAFFQNELEAYLVLVQDGGFDPMAVKSSYAGALGMPQFMPSTYRQYAVSGSKAYPNLFGNAPDSIGSIGNYLSQMGWRKGGPIAVPAHLAKGVVPNAAMQNNSLSLEALGKMGVHAAHHMDGKLKANLIILQNQTGQQYWLIFHNFYVIKRYNSSTLYAMAVYQLGQKILEQQN